MLPQIFLRARPLGNLKDLTTSITSIFELIFSNGILILLGAFKINTQFQELRKSTKLDATY